jgi:hypothetical protein
MAASAASCSKSRMSSQVFRRAHRKTTERDAGVRAVTILDLDVSLVLRTHRLVPSSIWVQRDAPRERDAP